MSEAVADWSGDRDYTGGDNSSGAQNVGDGDINAPMVGKDGKFTGINVSKARDIKKLAETITIYAVPEPGKLPQTFSVKKMRVHATPASILAVASSVITVATFVTGGMTIRELWVGVQNSVQLTEGALALPVAFWWFLAFTAGILLTFAGWSILKFLRRHVLWIPKRRLFRALAGVRCRDGRTRLASMRLGGTCADCPQRKLRFTRDEHGPKARCTRSRDHGAYIDVTKNDFDDPIH